MSAQRNCQNSSNPPDLRERKQTFIQGHCTLTVSICEVWKPTGHFNVKPFNFITTEAISNNEAFRFTSVTSESLNAGVKLLSVPVKFSGHPVVDSSIAS